MELIIMVVAAIVLLAWLSGRPVGRATDDGCSRPQSDCSACGFGCVSMKAMANSSGDPEYFDDEELDAFAGRAADSYTADEVELFREVLYTMDAGEVELWWASLRQRGVELPQELRDEAVMLIGDAAGAAPRRR